LIGICLAITASPAVAHAEHCSTVVAEYSVYANGDRLRVIGSSHLLSVVVDPLDKRLEKAGWEHAVAYGKFVICSARAVSPKKLTIHDQVRVKDFSRIRIVRH